VALQQKNISAVIRLCWFGQSWPRQDNHNTFCMMNIEQDCCMTISTIPSTILITYHTVQEKCKIYTMLHLKHYVT